MARPSKLTPELQAKICTLLSAGKRLDVACAECDVDRTTLAHWKAEAARGSEAHAEFTNAVARAFLIGEGQLFDEVRKGDPDKSARWLLERTRPRQYAPRLNVKLEEGLEVLLNDVEQVCGAKDCGCYEAILTRLAAREAGEGEDPGESGEG